ncbi:ABC transporter related protein [Thermodesulfatator indicus DSM 15286]|uniref:Lipopolysaccharide export system ATP-binding protein LptB n=1 Tax=Thermodesulfatator indicus (strain DSM 15286 / JCM 11887 / CIR29812) TaxID=667014 RepID=F8A9N6_THEID|nr:LPS export ABC transporter ATP-binding protein [Thermodesulfatator indicus]AEH45267.1 ABC transporter related protein [Thermodesulfatator indicus DSM 15286]
MAKTLKAKNLCKRFGKREVVKGVSLEVSTQQVVGLLGPNGAGKTTTFYMVCGLLPVDDGKVFLDQKEITQLPIHQRAWEGIVYLPQEPSVFRRLTVAENILLVLEILKIPRKERKKRLDDLLESFGLTSLKDQKAYALSGGERRRVEIMRALAREPEFLLLDEPFAGIDPIAVADLKEIIKNLKQRGLGILISDHNVRETLLVCDFAYIVADGQVIASGKPEEIAENPLARELYLGKDFRLN